MVLLSIRVLPNSELTMQSGPIAGVVVRVYQDFDTAKHVLGKVKRMVEIGKKNAVMMSVFKGPAW